MAGSAQKGARAPESSKQESSKRDERETPQEQAAVTARRGPQPPAGVVEDSTTRSEVKSEEVPLVENSGPSQNREAAKQAAKSMVIGRDREAVVVMDMAAPFSQVVTLDRLLDPHTGLVVETLQEPRTEEETRKELGKVRREAAKRAANQ